MNNRIYLNYMTKTYHDFIKANQASSQGFAGCIKGSYEKRGQQAQKSCTCPKSEETLLNSAGKLAASRKHTEALEELLASCEEQIAGKGGEAAAEGNGASEPEATAQGSGASEPEATIQGSGASEIEAASQGSGAAEMETIYDKMAVICGCTDSECCQAAAKTEKSKEEMTLEEYKQYIYDKIAGMPMDPSQIKNSVAVHITDAGFEAMKQDPEYEAWVLNTVQNDLNFRDPWGGMGAGRYVIHCFGATKEEYRGYSFSKPDRNAARRRRMEKSFWEERRLRQKKIQKKNYEEWLKKRALIRRIQQQLFNEKNISWAAAGFEAKKRVH